MSDPFGSRQSLHFHLGRRMYCSWFVLVESARQVYIDYQTCREFESSRSAFDQGSPLSSSVDQPQNPQQTETS